MWRVTVFVIIFGQTIYYFYSALRPERSTLFKTFPFKNPERRQKLLLGLGCFFLFLCVLLVYATVMQSGQQN